MGQHKRPSDPNKRPNTHVQKRQVNYLSFGRIPYKPNFLLERQVNYLSFSQIKSLSTNDKEAR